ncbi:MAG: hypothetical protein EOP00_24755 [Pedobacter sp.]|nr:MAG: hypothetical protein EOP00_24755 [Pedobacter sp.]
MPITLFTASFTTSIPSSNKVVFFLLEVPDFLAPPDLPDDVEADFLAVLPLALLLAEDFPSADLEAEPVFDAEPEPDLDAEDFAPAPLVEPSFLLVLLLVFADEPAPLLLLAELPLEAVPVLLFAAADVADPSFLAPVPEDFAAPDLLAPPVLFFAVAVEEEAEPLLAEDLDFDAEPEPDLDSPEVLLEEVEEDFVPPAAALFAPPFAVDFFFVSFSVDLVDFVAMCEKNFKS